MLFKGPKSRLAPEIQLLFGGKNKKNRRVRRFHRFPVGLVGSHLRGDRFYGEVVIQVTKADGPLRDRTLAPPYCRLCRVGENNVLEPTKKVPCSSHSQSSKIEIVKYSEWKFMQILQRH